MGRQEIAHRLRVQPRTYLVMLAGLGFEGPWLVVAGLSKAAAHLMGLLALRRFPHLFRPVFRSVFAADISSDLVATVLLAGLVLAETGTLPRVGDRVESQGHELTVERMDAYKLTQIRVSRLDLPADGPDSGDPAPSQ